MRKIYLILSVMCLMALASCDDVPVNERLTYVEPPEVGRAILIEDFTGQYCVNCPRASEEIERLVEQYGDSVIIAVAIHSGPFSKQKGNPSPLYTELGDLYFNKWGLSAQPVGLVDRIFGGMALSFTDWGGGVNYELTQSATPKAPVAFVTSTTVDDDTSQVSIEVQTIGLDSVQVSGNLQVWLIEDSIDNFQLMPDGSTQEHYNHMHVLRASVNDPWGDGLHVLRGEVVTKSYNITLDPAWVPEHCAIVTFLYDESGVRQVSKTKLTH